MSELKEFVIDSMDKADWYLKKLAELDAEEALIKEQSSKMIERVRTNRECLQALFSQQLETFARAQVEKNGKGRKSIILFYGTLAFRTVPSRLTIKDDREALDHARSEKRDFYQLKEVLDTQGYLKYAKEQLEQTGEILPGTERTEERESFSINFGRKEVNK